MTIGNATNDQFVNFISPTINFKTTGDTILFTVPATVNFCCISYTQVCDTATAPNGDSDFNIGWTAALYSDFLTAQSFALNAADTSITVLSGAQVLLMPAGTAIRVNILTGDTGTALTGRLTFQGFYIS